jgi:hypothetical protein
MTAVRRSDQSNVPIFQPYGEHRRMGSAPPTETLSLHEKASQVFEPATVAFHPKKANA